MTVAPWPSAGRSTCLHCDSFVTDRFGRVFGDENDRVHRCPECDTYARLTRGPLPEKTSKFQIQKRRPVGMEVRPMSEFVRANRLYDVENWTPIAHPAHQASDADVRRALEAGGDRQ